MELIVLIPGFFIGIFLFLVLNEIFQIYYFGFKGIATTFFGCWFAGNIIVVLLGFAAKWLIILFAVIWLFSKLTKGNKEPAQQQKNPSKKDSR